MEDGKVLTREEFLDLFVALTVRPSTALLELNVDLPGLIAIERSIDSQVFFFEADKLL